MLKAGTVQNILINKEQIEVVNATEVIETAEPPVHGNSEKERFFHRSSHESGERGQKQMPLYQQEVQERFL